MNPKCARCQKTVYPMEKLNCLDKYWHKGCFNCEVCRMTLNMKNYKGYNKNPYCNAHYPQSKPTVVSETPEIARVMQQSQQQSLTKYHEDYEKSKIKGYTPVVDTPENIRLRQQSKIQSQVKYHEDFEKQKGKAYHTVIDDPELTRVKKNTVIQSNLAYQGVKEKLQTMESRRQMIPGEHPMPPPGPAQQLGTLMDPPTHGMESMSLHDGHDRMMQQQQQQEEDRHLASMRRQENPPISIQKMEARMAADASYAQFKAKGKGKVGGRYQQVRLKPGKIEDYDPMTHPDAQPKFEAPAAVSEPEPVIQSGGMMRAVFDYTAAEDDEISFMDGDVIVNCVKIDDGWMTGTVQRTGQSGMLPANYVEPMS